MLSTEATSGRFDGDCNWLDMDALRSVLLGGPSGDDVADLRRFARIHPAMRVWHLAERFGALSSPLGNAG